MADLVLESGAVAQRGHGACAGRDGEGSRQGRALPSIDPSDLAVMTLRTSNSRDASFNIFVQALKPGTRCKRARDPAMAAGAGSLWDARRPTPSSRAERS